MRLPLRCRSAAAAAAALSAVVCSAPATAASAEAWDSGASAWTPRERAQHANDLGDDRLPIAVSAVTNRAKADEDVREWVPPYQPYDCTYLADPVAMKARWGLAVDPAEQAAIADRAAARRRHRDHGCPHAGPGAGRGPARRSPSAALRSEPVDSRVA
ncbi:hypothetical protein [Embleya sp. MST-111070]|uniref:hypothetical protein n=1 Tax=Embleya sp. MST-111070 TaxID=3398231 RepID=UPI003F737E6D